MRKKVFVVSEMAVRLLSRLSAKTIARSVRFRIGKLLKQLLYFFSLKGLNMEDEDKTVLVVFIFVGVVVAASLFALGIAIGAAFL
jgi:hypothetical protein